MRSSTLFRHTRAAVLGLAAFVALTFVVSPYSNLQLAQTAYLWCAAAGLTLLIGLGGIFSLGQGAFMAVGAYTAALLLQDQRWPLAAVLGASTLAAAVLGLLMAAVCSRLQGPYAAAVTLTLAVAVPSLAEIGALDQVLQGDNGVTVSLPTPPDILGHHIPVERWQAWICALCAAIVMWVLANLRTSRYGRDLRAAADDEPAAALCGIHAARAQFLAFTLTAGAAGVAGALLAWVTSLAAPSSFTLTLSLLLLAAVVVGGQGSLTGALWGSLLLVLVPDWASSLHSATGLPSDVTDNLPAAVFAIALIAVISVFPAGLQGALARLTLRARGLLVRTTRESRGNQR
ncbi:branched-chain amino acid ABC transporter permease [Streptomyces sp. NPDC005529]|uniref:branched-chain amino acid ABC transporter permease n=1 Tax=unclassified Streptomyces TaxID=2593676 RepID=UPI00339DCAAE